MNHYDAVYFNPSKFNGRIVSMMPQIKIEKSNNVYEVPIKFPFLGIMNGRALQVPELEQALIMCKTELAMMTVGSALGSALADGRSSYVHVSAAYTRCLHGPERYPGRSRYRPGDPRNYLGTCSQIRTCL
jgi:hypothetical protein